MNRPELRTAKYPRNAACAVTTSWDDNDSHNLEMLEILNSLELKGTFYVSPGKSRDIGLTDSQLQTLAATNEIGSHTWSHVSVRRCDVNTLKTELKASKEYIERITGSHVVGIAYPWGEYSCKAEEMVREHGYLFARTVEEGTLMFPPPDPYAWGVSVQALPRPRLLSRRAHVYLRNLASDWRKLAAKLFDKALRTESVWHLFGHAWEILDRPGLREDLQEVLRRVAGREDVWYATNGMLFLNEIARRSVEISEERKGSRSIFSVQVSSSLGKSSRAVVPLRLIVPKHWNERFNMEVAVADSGGFQTGRRSSSEVWLDILGEKAHIEVEPQ